MVDDRTDERQWLQRAALLVNRESDLRRQIGLILLGGAVLGPALNVLDYGLSVGAVLEGAGIGLLAALVLVFLSVENRMESVFPEYGDDEETVADDDSFRARYVRGEIDHETFKRRLNEKLREPTGAGNESAEATLREQFARGEVSESEYRDRLATLRETVAPPDSVDSADSVDTLTTESSADSTAETRDNRTDDSTIETDVND